MYKKLIILEIISALVIAVLAAIVLGLIAATFGGNFMTDFAFMGERGYEATGILGIIFGLPIGGILGSYLTRHRFPETEQKPAYAIGIGLLAGTILLLTFFANQSQGRYDQLRFYSGKVEIESVYPEMKNLDCFASCSYKYEKDGEDYYFTYIVNGSGLPIVKAVCFKVDGESVVTKVGEFPNPADSYLGYKDVNPKNCSGIK